jgi:hypothetical protein
MVRFLRKRGWTLLREGAPKTGTVAAILGQAGVSPEEFQEL